MKSLSLLINESLKNSKHNKVEAKKILKLIKAGKIKVNKNLHNKITAKLKKKHILESQEVDKYFYDNYRNWVECTIENWKDYWDGDHDAMDRDLDTAEDYFDNEFDTFCDDYEYDDPDYDSDRLSKIVDSVCSVYRSEFEDRYGGEDYYDDDEDDDDEY